MKDDTVDLWALDEVHFQQQGSRCRMWVPPETKDPVVYHQPTRKSVGYFAAVRLRDGEFLYRRETGRFNGDSFWEFLKVFKEASTVDGRRVLAISDNAQYHRSRLHLDWRVQQAPKFGLDFLPPYSPELNPHRTRLEAHSPTVPPQPLLCIPRQRRRCRRNSVRRLDQTQRFPSETMRNYLRRRV
jgi:hypothetical protein